jgi:branched-chain amino acid transport system ATP-binding protein
MPVDMNGSDMLLALHDVHTYYGDSHILQGLSLHVNRGECVALLGTNGMGKTTTLRTVMGITPAKRGGVQFNGANITNLAPFKIARLGLGYVPEERGLFASLSVIDNLRVPFLNLRGSHRKPWSEIAVYIYSLFPVLGNRQSQLAGSLSGGEQQMLATARALISGHRMILLDEPTEGLAPIVVENLVKALHKLKAGGHTILLVEQNFRTASDLADRGYILQKGRIDREDSMEHLGERLDLLHRHLEENEEPEDRSV